MPLKLEPVEFSSVAIFVSAMLPAITRSLEYARHAPPSF
jgi:hypothetical protein